MSRGFCLGAEAVLNDGSFVCAEPIYLTRCDMDMGPPANGLSQASQ